MDLGLRGKVALVAASSAGLGRAVAEELAREGANLVMCARGEERLAKVAKSIRDETGVRVEVLAADLSKLDDVQRVTDTALHAFGQVDVLVTNAGGPPAGSARGPRGRR